MDILVKIFTAEANASHEASYKVQKAFNDFVATTSMDRIVSITTNTTCTTDSGDYWFVYTLTLVYEPRHIDTTEPAPVPAVDDPTKDLF